MKAFLMEVSLVIRNFLPPKIRTFIINSANILFLASEMFSFLVILFFLNRKVNLFLWVSQSFGSKKAVINVTHAYFFHEQNVISGKKAFALSTKERQGRSSSKTHKGLIYERSLPWDLL